MENPAFPATASTVTVHGVKLDGWSFTMPEDDFVMEQVAFKALWISVEDAGPADRPMTRRRSAPRSCCSAARATARTVVVPPDVLRPAGDGGDGAGGDGRAPAAVLADVQRDRTGPRGTTRR